MSAKGKLSTPLFRMEKRLQGMRVGRPASFDAKPPPHGARVVSSVTWLDRKPVDHLIHGRDLRRSSGRLTGLGHGNGSKARRFLRCYLGGLDPIPLTSSGGCRGFVWKGSFRCLGGVLACLIEVMVLLEGVTVSSDWGHGMIVAGGVDVGDAILDVAVEASARQARRMVFSSRRDRLR